MTTPARRALAIWCVLLGVGALLLVGRYDFTEAGGQFARAGYLSTLYYLLVVPPLCWVLARRLGASARVAWTIGGATLAIACAPYRWLGLGHLRHTVVFHNTPKSGPVWFPAAIHDSGAPHERLLLAVSLLLAVAGVIAVARRQGGPLLRRALPGLALSAAVVVQAGLHTSTRSPYTFIPLVESAAKPWYRLNLFPNGQGAVNGDAPYFTSIDDHLKGMPKPVEPLVLRRSFPHWLGAHASYFFNPYYVYLFLDLALWIASTLALYGWARRIAPRETALFAAAIGSTLTGFIVYVAQPMSYFAALASLPILLWGMEALLVDEPRSGLAFGALLGLTAATYDVVPLIPFLGVYAWLRGVPLRATIAPLVVGMAIYVGWPILQHVVLHVPTQSVNVTSNSDLATNAVKTTLALLRGGELGALFERVIRGVGVWGASLLWAFTGVTTLAAVVGIVAAPTALRRIVGTLLVPSLLVVVLLIVGNARWGQVRLGELPRFVTLSWPAVVLAAAIALERLAHWCRLRGHERLARALPWSVVLLIAVVNNAGAFGVVRFDYHFYWPTPVGCDPYGAVVCSGP